ncbi:MAG: TRAP transporter TatT component family protein [Smithella sp.]
MIDTSLDDLVEKLLDSKNYGEIKNGLPDALLVVTGVTELSPNNYKLLTRTCMLYTAYGLFVEDENPDYAVEIYDIAIDYRLRALKLNKEFRRKFEQGLEYAQCAKHLGKEYVDSLAWTSTAIGLKTLLTLANAAAAMDVPLISGLALKAIELDETYFYGISHIVMGIVNSILPEFARLTGGVENSQREFNAADRAGGNRFMMAKYFRAKYYCPLAKDQVMFNKSLNGAIETDSAILPGGYILNELAKVKSKFLLDRAVIYFPQ